VHFEKAFLQQIKNQSVQRETYKTFIQHNVTYTIFKF